jgi:hypothetical protein
VFLGFTTAPNPDIVTDVNLLPRIGACVLSLLLLLGVSTASGDSLNLPLEKKVQIGESVVVYAGQTLRFTTSVPLLVRLEPLSPGRIQFKIKVHPGYAIPTGPVGSSENNLLVHWVNYGTDVYQGGAPSETIEGVLNTEGGFVDR